MKRVKQQGIDIFLMRYVSGSIDTIHLEISWVRFHLSPYRENIMVLFLFCYAFYINGILKNTKTCGRQQLEGCCLLGRCHTVTSPVYSIGNCQFVSVSVSMWLFMDMG